MVIRTGTPQEASVARSGKRGKRWYAGPSLTSHLTLQPGDRVRLKLGPLLESGEASAQLDGAPVMVAGGLSGEEVVVEVVKVFPERVATNVAEILAASSERVTPVCPYYLQCSGCQLQHMAYSAQLEFKRQRIVDELRKWPGVASATVLPTLESPKQFGYRNHARFTVRKGGQQAGEVGYVNATTRRFIRIDRCLIMDDPVNEALLAVQGHMQGLSQMSVRSGAGGVLIQPKLKVTSIAVESGQRSVEEEVRGRKFKIAASSFFQVNTVQLSNVVDVLRVGLRLTGEESLVDAYCGVGTFAILLAPHAKSIVGIEDSASAVADARSNAVGLGNVEFIEGKAEDALGKIERPVDAIVLDPPRAGCQPGTLEAVIAKRPTRVALVSCEPAALARDLARLCEGPFILESVRPVDMFPQTRHVEAVALLRLSSQHDANPR
jgi:23S rRNA (uracil1939-C5)-methyltransferase